MFNKYPDMVDVPQLCEMLCCGKTKAYELIAAKAFRTLRIGKKMLIPKTDVINFLENLNRKQEQAAE